MGCVSSKKKLSKADLEFLVENTEFTKDQIAEWYEGFIVSIYRKDMCEKYEHLLSQTYVSNNYTVHRHNEIAFAI